MTGHRRVAVRARWVGVAISAMVVMAACSSTDAAPITPIPITSDRPTPSVPAGAGGAQTGPASPAGAGQPAAAVAPPPAATPVPTPPPVPIECSPPSPEPSGTPQGSNLTFSGACNFTETAAVPCILQPDDFIFQIHRSTPDGPSLDVELNVEYYKGPGSYSQGVQVIVEIPDNGTIYEWSTTNGAATIDASQKSGSVDNLVLPADAGTPTTGTISLNGSWECQ